MATKQIEAEKQTIEFMIRLYCKHKEKNEDLCESCEDLLTYAHQRLDHCRYGNNKKACKNCPTHCYKPALRLKIRKVMIYAGPRMPFLAPMFYFRYLMNKH
ncbi:nitrous oxide-stimulated promoter family protein [Parabacteroides sp. OttesenSCG-928-G07]|nr:nitrous oxide-stimulated promoter family protein [Parabacteroides sp. OttesenSCG-928-G07]